MFKSAISIFARKSIATASTTTATAAMTVTRASIWTTSTRSTAAFQTSSVRAFSVSAAAQHGHIERPAPGTGIKVTFKDAKGGVIREVEGNDGDDLLTLAHEYDIDLEGACGGSIACSTCHLIIDPEHYDLLEEPGDDENDMLDLAYGLTDTSRLGCQVYLSKNLNGMSATLPSATRNMYVDGHKPSPH